MTILDKETQFRIHKDAIPSSHSQTNERGFFSVFSKRRRKRILGNEATRKRVPSTPPVDQFASLRYSWSGVFYNMEQARSKVSSCREMWIFVRVNFYLKNSWKKEWIREKWTEFIASSWSANFQSLFLEFEFHRNVFGLLYKKFAVICVHIYFY